MVRDQIHARPIRQKCISIGMCKVMKKPDLSGSCEISMPALHNRPKRFIICSRK